MSDVTRHVTSDLVIVGAGLAGAAAAVFARKRGLSCVLAGDSGALAFTSGHLDLLGVLDGRLISDPWRELERLREKAADHPLAQIERPVIEEALAEFLSFVADHGIAYAQPGAANIMALTPAGLLKPTLSLPRTMEKGAEAWRNRASCVIFGFHGLLGFSAAQMVANLRRHWPALQGATLSFPGHGTRELYAESAARALEVPATREQLAQLLLEHVGDAAFIGLPAILGMHRPDHVHAELERLTGRRIFEIPTMPPSIPGTRLRELFEQHLGGDGITFLARHRVTKVSLSPAAIEVEMTGNTGDTHVQASALLLATGRFLSGGLTAQFDGVTEPLLGLPLFQPPSRRQWYGKQYLQGDGHLIHRAGLEADHCGRVLDENSRIVDPRLFCAGTILAYQDWIRQRCGAGLALATSHRAVTAAERLLASR